jgi:hypothetical protein
MENGCTHIIGGTSFTFEVKEKGRRDFVAFGVTMPRTLGG